MAFTIIVGGTRHGVDADARHDRAGLLTRVRIFALTAMMCLSGVQAMAADGLTTIRSSLSDSLRPGKGPSLLQLAAGQAIVQRIVLLGRQPARDVAHDRNYLLHDITAISAGGTSQ
jgi:hypothetical protein